ncbi:hypothetical protein [Citricoccus nitrophenolicus]|uniref:hypothetical protein n=1 Tax=Citricoccus nitrophenolicus TaxID=863575 RepID=UPI0031EC14D3
MADLSPDNEGNEGGESGESMSASSLGVWAPAAGLGTVGYWDDAGCFRGTLVHDATDLWASVQARWETGGWSGLRGWIHLGIESGGFRLAADDMPIDVKAYAVKPFDPRPGVHDERGVRGGQYFDSPAFSAAAVVSPWGVRALEEAVYRRYERSAVLGRYAEGVGSESLRERLLGAAEALAHSPEERDTALAWLSSGIRGTGQLSLKESGQGIYRDLLTGRYAEEG